jgi:hypothetical protein
MRWNVIKEAWQLAKESFPKVERLYVSFPDRFRGSGECDVVDLEKPGESLGKIAYKMGCHDKTPVVFLSINKTSKSVKLPRQAALDLKAETVPLVKASSICADDIMAKYGDSSVLGEQLAYLCVGHEEGPLYQSECDSISEAALAEWVKKAGFPQTILPYVQDNLEKMGVRTLEDKGFNLKSAKGKKERKFPDFARVRVIDPRLLSENRGGQIRGYDKKTGLYRVLIDGSSNEVVLHEQQLAENPVGSINKITNLPRMPHPGSGPEVQP